MLRVLEQYDLIKLCLILCNKFKFTDKGKKSKVEIRIGPFTTEGVCAKLKPILAEIYSDMIMTLTRVRNNVMYYHEPTRTDYSIDRKSVNQLLTNPSSVINK